MPLFVIPSEVENGAAQYDIKAGVAKRHSFYRLYPKVVQWQMRRQFPHQSPSLGGGSAGFVYTKNFKAALQQVDEVPPGSTTRVQHPHSRNDSSLQELIEQINVDAAKPFLEIEGR